MFGVDSVQMLFARTARAGMLILLEATSEVRGRRMMSDSGEEIVALSDKMGLAVRHRFRQKWRSWSSKRLGLPRTWCASCQPCSGMEPVGG